MSLQELDAFAQRLSQVWDDDVEEVIPWSEMQDYQKENWRKLAKKVLGCQQNDHEQLAESMNAV